MCGWSRLLSSVAYKYPGSYPNSHATSNKNSYTDSDKSPYSNHLDGGMGHFASGGEKLYIDHT